MNESYNTTILTIGIPTYNRGIKLDRLLENLEDQINKSVLQERIEILISDNASSDNTKDIVNKYIGRFNHFKYINNKKNIGYDLNVLNVYNNSKSDFVWLLADDDIPFQGSIITILSALSLNNLDILLFSFAQPPGSKLGTFNFPEELHITQNYDEIIELLLRWKKISIYILRKIIFTLEKDKTIYDFVGQGWCHVILALTVLNNNEFNSRLGVISKILAECDEEYDVLTWTPEPILNSFRIAYHPLIKTINPQLAKKNEKISYLEAIQFCFAAKRGTLRVKDIKAYNEFIGKLPFRFKFIFLKPKFLIQFFLLKLKLVNFYNRFMQINQ